VGFRWQLHIPSISSFVLQPRYPNHFLDRREAMDDGSLLRRRHGEVVVMIRQGSDTIVRLIEEQAKVRTTPQFT